MALVYISTSDIENITGTKVGSTIETAIGEQAEREVVAYLRAKGLTSPSGDIVKSAVLKLAHAGVLLWYSATGNRIKSDNSTGTVYQDLPDSDATGFQWQAKDLTEQAYRLLDEYAASQTTSGSYSPFVYKVNR